MCVIVVYSKSFFFFSFSFLLLFFFSLLLSVQPFTQLKDLLNIKDLLSSLRAFIASTDNKHFSNKSILGANCTYLYNLLWTITQTVNKPSLYCLEVPQLILINMPRNNHDHDKGLMSMNT